MRLLPLVVFACALGACSAAEPPPDVPVRVDSLQASPNPGSADGGLAAAWQRWRAQGITDYRFSYTQGCFCPPQYRGPFDVTVRDGDVAAVTYGGEGEPANRARSEYETIDGLFDLIATAYDREAATVSVTYDAATGQPTEVYIDYDERLADEEVSFTVEAARPLDE